MGSKTKFAKARKEFGEDEFDQIPIPDGTGHTQLTYIIRPEMVTGLAFKGRTEPCIRFRNWLRKEVIPSLQETGSYTVSGPQIADRAEREFRLQERRAEIQMKQLQIQNRTQLLALTNHTSPVVKQYALDELANSLLPTGQLAIKADPDPLNPISMQEYGRKAGWTRNQAYRYKSQMGKVVKAHYYDLKGCDPESHERMINGNMTEVAIYRKSFEPEIIKCLKKYHEERFPKKPVKSIHSMFRSTLPTKSHYPFDPPSDTPSS